MIRFWELLRCTGVDEKATPNPGMVVPYGGSNLVLLETEGKRVDVRSDNGAVQVHEVDGTEIRRKLIEANITYMQPSVDRQTRESLLPTSMFWYDKPRFYEVTGRKGVVGFPGAKINAYVNGRPVATLEVVVLDVMAVKFAIREVKVPDGSGGFRFHSGRPCDVQSERSAMNAVWIPQANIRFDVVPAEPLIVDDRLPATRVELGTAFGMRNPGDAVFPDVVDLGKLRSFFAKHAVPGADVTLFSVDKLAGNPNGQMTPLGVGLIGKSRGQTTTAHEAGHFIGGHVTKGAWVDLGETFNEDPDEDLRELMRDGGAGYKIPYRLVKEFRMYPARRKSMH